MPVARENEEGANTIQTGAAIADNVNSKPGNNRNASSENERKRSVFAGSRSGLNDESVSNGKKEHAQAARERREQTKSEWTARDSQEGVGREQRAGRVSALRLSIVAVAVLIGISTAIYDRADDTLPDRTTQSATEIQREATPPSTATAPQGLLPVGQGSSTPSGPSPAPAPVGTDVSSSRAVPSAAPAEREGAPVSSPGAATISQVPASVARSRARARESTSPSGPRSPSAARVDSATVIGWRAADPPDRTEPRTRTRANVTGAAYFTRGSHEDDVVRVQGTPSRIDRYPSVGYETWRYGRNTVTISTGSRRVTDWSNVTGNLKVRLIPGANVTASAYFTRGSHEDDVVRVQGTPSRIDRYPSVGYETWRYGRNTVTISTGSRRVTDWSNVTGNLKVRLIPGANVTASAYFTRGSHEDDVVRVQGTPSRIDRYPSVGYETWRYGRNTVTISTGSRRVTDWSNVTGNLKVRLIPGANVTASAYFTRGSHEDDVVRVQGTPSRIDRYPSVGYETWRYGRNTVTISTGSRRVTDWSNVTGNLKVRLIPGANVTASAYFTRGSHEDDVVRVQGTPSRIDRYPSVGYETWRYGRNTVTISTGSRRVTDWSNVTGNLKVRLIPE